MMSEPNLFPSAHTHLSPRERLALALVLLIVAGTFLPVLASGQIWDDKALMVPEPGVGLFDLWLRPYLPPGDRFVSPYYRPLPRISLLLTAGMASATTIQHAFNLLLHLLNTALSMSLTRRLFGGSLPVVLLVGLLFGLHPLHVEPVAWIAGRPDLLAAFFGQLALWLLPIEVARGPGEPSPSSQSPLLHWALATLCLFAGLLSKEAAAPLVLLLPVVALVRPLARFRLGLLLWGLTTGGWLLLRHLAFSPLEHLLAHAQGLPWALRPAMAARILTSWAQRFFYPGELCAEWEIPSASSMLEGPWGLTLLMLTLLGVWAMRRWRTPQPDTGFWPSPASDLIAVGLLFYGLLMLPVLNLIPIDETVAERYGYLPSLGLMWTVAGVLSLVLERLPQPPRALQHRVVGGLMAVAGLLLTVSMVKQVSAGLIPWLNEPLFFAHQVQCAPGSARARVELGRIQRDAGRPDLARTLWQEAHRMAPHDAHVLNLLADVELRQGLSEQALVYIEQSLQRQPESVPALLLQGRILLRLDRLEEAERSMSQALSLQPERLETLHDLSLVALKRRNFALAETCLQKLLSLEGPQFETINALGIVAMTKGQREQGLGYFRQATGLAPERRDGWCNLARALRGNAATEGGGSEGTPSALSDAEQTELSQAQKRCQAALN